MFGAFLSSELKKWVRDPMMSFMIWYPMLFALLGRYVLPYAADASGFSILEYADFALVILALMCPMIFGAITGFSILDDRDDAVLSAVQVTPLSIHQFLSFRFFVVFVMSFLACIFVLWFSDIYPLGWVDMVAISFLASLGAPLSGILINVLASNKIEGFAVMKGTGMLLVFPILALLFNDARELLFAIVPGFWPAKLLSIVVRGRGLTFLGYSQYLVIGTVYAILLSLLAYRWFLRKLRV